MATKKSTKSRSKTNKSTTTKSAAIEQGYFGKCFVALALIITALLFGLFYYMGQAKKHEENKKLEAFKTLAYAYVEELATIEPGEDTGESTIMAGIGLTDDDDLYIDILRTKLENGIPVSKRSERVHFQCDDHETIQGCGQAFWYGEWEDTTAEYREQYRTFKEKSEEFVNRINAATTDKERETIRAEYQEFYKSYEDLI